METKLLLFFPVLCCAAVLSGMVLMVMMVIIAANFSNDGDRQIHDVAAPSIADEEEGVVHAVTIPFHRQRRRWRRPR